MLKDYRSDHKYINTSACSQNIKNLLAFLPLETLSRPEFPLHEGQNDDRPRPPGHTGEFYAGPAAVRLTSWCQGG